jgi:hypothetical protein
LSQFRNFIGFETASLSKTWLVLDKLLDKPVKSDKVRPGFPVKSRETVPKTEILEQPPVFKKFKKELKNDNFPLFIVFPVPRPVFSDRLRKL